MPIKQNLKNRRCKIVRGAICREDKKHVTFLIKLIDVSETVSRVGSKVFI